MLIEYKVSNYVNLETSNELIVIKPDFDICKPQVYMATLYRIINIWAVA